MFYLQFLSAAGQFYNRVEYNPFVCLGFGVITAIFHIVLCDYSDLLPPPHSDSLTLYPASLLFLPPGECIPPRTISLAAATFNLLVTLANLDIATFQVRLECCGFCFVVLLRLVVTNRRSTCGVLGGGCNTVTFSGNCKVLFFTSTLA